MTLFEVSLDIQDANHCAAFPAYGIQGFIELDLWFYGPLLALALARIHSFFEDFWRSVGKADVVWLRNLFIEYSWACMSVGGSLKLLVGYGMILLSCMVVLIRDYRAEI